MGSTISLATKGRSFDRQISRYIEYISIEDIVKIRLTEENSMKLFGFLLPCIAPALSVTLFQSVEVELSRGLPGRSVFRLEADSCQYNVTLSESPSEKLFTCCAKDDHPQGRASPKASSGLDYSRGTKRVPPGVSKLGRTPRRNQGPRQEMGEPEGRMAFLGFFSTPESYSAPEKVAPQPKLDCPYEEHCEHDEWWGGIVCDCCECCDNCRQPTCWTC